MKCRACNVTGVDFSSDDIGDGTVGTCSNCQKCDETEFWDSINE